jgi:hypothetical protein
VKTPAFRRNSLTGFFAHVPTAVLRQPVCQNAIEPNRLDSGWSLKPLAFKKGDMEIKSVRHLNF